MSTQFDGNGRWREYFRTANADIFEIIEEGILVAASDHPKEFKSRRDRIAEVLFSTNLTRCTQCERVELPVFGENAKESKVDSIRDEQTCLELNQTSNYSYGDAEALTEEIEDENLDLQEVLRIKETLNSFEDQSDSVLFESLRRLQLMRLTVSILRATEIGKTVNGLRRHSAKQIRLLARELIVKWKAVVDAYMEAMQQESRVPQGSGEDTPDSINPSVVEDEEGLPSPPMDDCAFLMTQNVDFSRFFDGMDDDGNVQNGGEFNKNRPHAHKEDVILSKDYKVKQPKKQEAVPKPNDKPLKLTLGPNQSVKPNGEQRENQTPKLQKKPAIQPEKKGCASEDSIKAKLETAKRKLQERYQEAEKAKRQRTIQVMELHDLPKQGHGQRNPANKFGNTNRNMARGRR